MHAHKYCIYIYLVSMCVTCVFLFFIFGLLNPEWLISLCVWVCFILTDVVWWSECQRCSRLTITVCFLCLLTVEFLICSNTSVCLWWTLIGIKSKRQFITNLFVICCLINLLTFMQYFLKSFSKYLFSCSEHKQRQTGEVLVLWWLNRVQCVPGFYVEVHGGFLVKEKFLDLFVWPVLLFECLTCFFLPGCR